tara:strand:+ start:11556 stop:11801 length:246 start_codon:yes stop_codon:yes gene_type:complete
MSKEKKGDILNQLAIISDLIEKVAIESNASTLFYELDEEQYEEVYEYIKEKFSGEGVEEDSSGTFSILMGEITIMFSKNSA